MSYFFIINPGSNHHKNKHFVSVIETVLNKRNITFEYKITSTLEDAHIFSKEANEEGYEVIVAVGGDGTINKVLSGFYDERGKRISNAKLGVIHTGTSPDFCKSYGIPTKPISALKTLLNNFTKEISVAQIEFHTEKRERKIGYFACCANLGLGAQVAQNANSGIRKLLGDSLGTFVSILKSLINYKPTNMRIICDGKKRVIERHFNTFIGKTAFVASGMKVNHQLPSDDNRLYLLSLKKINFRNVLPALRAIYSGKPICNKYYISFEYIDSIEIMADDINNEIEFDGDPQGFLPCKISVAKDKLELITNGL
jgi:diacylglycerol kinase (ATP)